MLTCHDLYPHEKERPSGSLCRLYETMDGIILHAEENRQSLHELCNPPEHVLLAVIPHGNYEFLAHPMSRGKARRTLGIAEGRKVLLFFGYIRTYKGLDILLQAMEEVIPQIPEIPKIP